VSMELLEWFRRRRRTLAIRHIESHLDLTVGCVEALYEAITLSVSGLESPLQKLKELSRKEEEADYVRRDILNELSGSELLPDDKAVLMDLVRRIDWIADWAREAGRIMSIIRIEKLDEELKDNVLRMAERVKECVYMVKKSVTFLLTDVDKALENADRIEKLEEDIDDLYENCRRVFAKAECCRELAIGEVIMVAQFLDALENVADWCENTADQVRVIAVRVSKPGG